MQILKNSLLLIKIIIVSFRLVDIQEIRDFQFELNNY